MIRADLRTIFLAFALLYAPGPAVAFVENVTHGYPNCMACHVSPTGGGLLNDYGRSLSKELMSTWGGWKNSEQPLFGALKNREKVKFGGHFRTIQTYLENSQVQQGRQFNMQKNVEVGVQHEKLWVVATAGNVEGPVGTPGRNDFVSERHYVLWDVSDEVKLRAGKFRLQFGLNDPNHTRPTKQGLGFGPSSESYILEFSKFSDKDEWFISSNLGRLYLPRNFTSEKSFSVTYSRYITEKSKAGASYLLGESSLARRSTVALHGIGSVKEHWILKGELDYQQSFSATSTTNRQDLVASSLMFGLQKWKGVLPYLIAEHLQQDLRDNNTQQSSYGLGLQWLPFPHIELQGEFKKQTIRSSSPEQSDSGWILLHWYI